MMVFWNTIFFCWINLYLSGILCVNNGQEKGQNNNIEEISALDRFLEDQNVITKSGIGEEELWLEDITNGKVY